MVIHLDWDPLGEVVPRATLRMVFRGTGKHICSRHLRTSIITLSASLRLTYSRFGLEVLRRIRHTHDRYRLPSSWPYLKGSECKECMKRCSAWVKAGRCSNAYRENRISSCSKSLCTQMAMGMGYGDGTDVRHADPSPDRSYPLPESQLPAIRVIFRAPAPRGSGAADLSALPVDLRRWLPDRQIT